MWRKVSSVRHNYLRLFFFLLCLAGVASCWRPAVTPFKVGTNHWIGYEPLYVAQEKGFYREQSIKVLELTSASQVAKALEQELIDGAALTLDEAIRLAERSDDYVVVSIFDYSFGGDAIVANDSLSQFSQLQNKRIGLEEGSVGHFMLHRAAQLNNIDVASLNILPIHINQHQEAFLSGEVDAVVTFDPVRTRLLNAGASQVFTSKEIPREIIDVLVVKRSKETLFRNQIAVLLEGWFKTVTLIKDGDEESLHLLARRSQLSVKEVRDMLQNIRIPGQAEVFEMLYKDTPEITPVIVTLREFLSTIGVIKSKTSSIDLLPHEKHLKYRH